MFAIRCRDLTGSVTSLGGMGESGSGVESIIATRDLMANLEIDADLYTPIDVSGDITGSIETGRSCLATIAASGEIAGPIEIGTGGSGGDLVASIVGDYGITSIRVHGDVGHPSGVPTVVQCRYGAVGELIVDGEVPPDGSLAGHDFEIRCAGIGLLDIGGTFAGIISTWGTLDYVTCDEIRIGSKRDSTGYFLLGDLYIKGYTLIDVWGQYDGYESGDALRLGTSPDGSLLRIGYGVNSPLLIGDDNSLEGQIILNGWNESLTLDLWTDTTQVGDGAELITLQSSTITSNYYPDLSSTLGGGAIGYVPFFLHDEDCIPTNGEVICAVPTLEANEDRETVILRHYGPIFDSKPSDEYKPLKIERKSNV